MQGPATRNFVFPKWTKLLFPIIGVSAMTVPAYLGVIVPFLGSPRTIDVGYAPVQPVGYSHALHVGQLGIDCRNCHTTVDKASFAAIPPTQTCMGCHTNIHPESAKLAPIRESWKTGKPVQWVKVHDLPDYAFFNHSAHVVRGVGCVECHGRVDKMEVVYQAQDLSMGWCIDCHRDPAPRLRPPDQVTNMAWGQLDDPNPLTRGLTQAQRRQIGEKQIRELHINPNTDCYTCHR